MNPTLQRLGRGLLDLVYPPRCVLCGHGDAFICAQCIDSLPRATGQRCNRCWQPVPDSGYCHHCAGRPLALTGLRSIFLYKDDTRRLIKKLKFSGQSCLAEPLADLMSPVLAGWLPSADVIVPVPMTRRQQRVRGFNQAELLAKRVGETVGLPVAGLLVRRTFMAAQERSTGDERWLNVQGAFGLNRDADVAGRGVVLLDDIATTGATLDACARVLLAAGATGVYGLTLARED